MTSHPSVSETPPLSERLASIRGTLEAHRQSHLLTFYDTLTPAEQAHLLGQLEQIDYRLVADLIEEHVNATPGAGEASPDAGRLEPAPYYPVDPGTPGRSWDAEACRERGEACVRDGRVAAFTVAGGQGTRLGWSGPKGTYPATVVTGKPLFRCFAEQLIAAQRKYGVVIPWYIMTSPANDAQTRAFFLDNNCFGLPRKNISMFPQAMLPAVDAETGSILLADRDAVAMSPDGHGGALRALRSSGAVEDMRARGIEHICYFQVDNPLVKVIDPHFIGLHVGADDSSGEMSSKMVAKTGPEERVGVFCREGGRTIVIEYTDFPDEMLHAVDESGRLRYEAGSIAIHLISAAFVEHLTADPDRFALPFHRALKRVAHVDLQLGERVEPESPNAVKFETFVFDALPRAESSIVLETERVEEFAPIKNATGADSPATSHQLQSERAARWLEAHGVRIPRRPDGGAVDAKIEISPLTALEPSDLTAVDLPARIEAGSEVVI